MKTALTLIRHAVALLTRHPLETVRVVAPAIVLMGGVGLIAVLTAPDIMTTDKANPDMIGKSFSLLPAALLAAFVLSYALMAILWHRHTLATKRAPEPWSARLLCGYLWRVMMLALIQLAVSLLLVLPLMMAERADGAVGTPSMISILLTTFMTQLVLLWLSLRLSLILPAAALGRPIPMAQSWQHTVRMARPLWGVAAALALMNTLLASVVTLLGPLSPGRALALELPIYIIEGLLIFSVLSTLYAQLIQNKQPGLT